MEPSAYIWQEGLVTCRDGGKIRVSFERLRQCQRCFEGEGCGAGVFSRLFSKRAAEIVLPDHQGLAVGQVVRVGIGARDMVILALIIYLLPLLAFILVAVLTASLPTEMWAQDLIGLATGAGAAGLVAYAASRLGGGVLNPRLEVLSSAAGRTALECSYQSGQL